jgi:hypothetical protein
MNTDLYYIRNKDAGFLGNAPIWYAQNGMGYTAYVMGAERFTLEEATEIVNGDRDKWEMYKCADIDARLHLIFDFQDVKRLGTNDPCGWSSGYAVNPFMDKSAVYSRPWNIAPQTCEYTATPTDTRKMINLMAYGYDKPFECMAIENHEGKPVALIPLDESNEENARFIVEACNNHKLLVEALEIVKDLTEGTLSTHANSIAKNALEKLAVNHG